MTVSTSKPRVELLVKSWHYTTQSSGLKVAIEKFSTLRGPASKDMFLHSNLKQKSRTLNVFIELEMLFLGLPKRAPKCRKNINDGKLKDHI